MDAVIGAPTGGINSFDEQMANSHVVQCLPSRSGLYVTVTTGSTMLTTAPPDSASAPAIVSELLTQKAKTTVIAAPNRPRKERGTGRRLPSAEQRHADRHGEV